jgi:hypothetical protein
VIDQAEGILTARTRGDAEAASTMLVARSQQDDRTLRASAEQLVRDARTR